MTGPPSPECHKNKIILRLTVVPDFHHEPEVSFTAAGGIREIKGRTGHSHSQIQSPLTQEEQV